MDLVGAGLDCGGRAVRSGTITRHGLTAAAGAERLGRRRWFAGGTEQQGLMGASDDRRAARGARPVPFTDKSSMLLKPAATHTLTARLGPELCAAGSRPYRVFRKKCHSFKRVL